MRTPDYQYRSLLQTIMNYGEEEHPIQGGTTRMITGFMLRFPMKNGFPLITERDLSGPLFYGALSEHIAFLHGARTHDELSSWGCRWWRRWVTPEKCAIFGLPAGDLGPGSYGAVWTAFPTAEGPPVNQIENVIELLKEKPFLRTLRISNWAPQYAVPGKYNARKVVVAPCHGDILIVANPEKKTLKIVHHQRSADVPVGLVFNIAQYAAFGMMVAQVIGYEFTELVHFIANAHIYEMQYSHVRELLVRNPKALPIVTLDPSVRNIFDFRPEHFILREYDSHPAMTIPTPE